ncbi:MAG: sugar ABC transporter permease [Turicibacter sp.]|nr:sugar ABC transporter permease [Turicibacter sp.]
MFRKLFKGSNGVAKPTAKETFWALLYLSPALVILVIFSLYPVVRSFYTGFFTEYNFFTHEVMARGIDNFIFIFNDRLFILALRNTFIFVFGVVPISVAISLGLAILLNSGVKFAPFFRSVYLLPFVTSTIAIASVWNWIYHTNHGIMNWFLGLFGVDPIAWITHPDHAMTALVIMSIWSSLGFNIVIFLAGLQTVNKQLYLAAKVDGASAFHRFTTVTLPMISPSLFFVSVMSVIGSFRVFGSVFALFQSTPGPVNSALTVVYYVYMQFYENWNFGVASAAALVLFAIIFIFTLIQMLVGRKLVHYN